jgi:hypothetical protein
MLHCRKKQSAFRVKTANEEEGMVNQNTTVIFGGAFYLG